MFDDLKQPEDIFEQTDKVAPQVTAPTDQPVTEPVQSTTAEAHKAAGRSFPWKIILLVIGIFIVIAAAFYLSMRILSSRTPVTPPPPSAEKAQEVEKVEEVEKIEEEQEEVVPSRVDTDKDGLTDEDEQGYGTSPRAEDTDSDGLFDPEEIRTWETDPLNPDTDGDGYLDGEEVVAGYDPNGPGVLRGPPTESD